MRMALEQAKRMMKMVMVRPMMKRLRMVLRTVLLKYPMMQRTKGWPSLVMAMSWKRRKMKMKVVGQKMKLLEMTVRQKWRIVPKTRLLQM
jgi:hypothetical protein